MNDAARYAGDRFDATIILLNIYRRCREGGGSKADCREVATRPAGGYDGAAEDYWTEREVDVTVDSEWTGGRHVPAGLKCNFCSHDGKKKHVDGDLVWAGRGKMAICKDCAETVMEMFTNVGRPLAAGGRTDPTGPGRQTSKPTGPPKGDPNKGG